jgi:hypothetical protein
MLKVVWTPGAAAAPDEDAYRRAVDTLSASYGGITATAQIPREPATATPDIASLEGVVRAWLTARALPHAAARLMLHGYSYDPRHGGNAAVDPFSTTYGYPGENGLDHRLSWLPLVGECDDAGARRQETSIAFAWVSTGSLRDYGDAGWSESYQYACVDLARLAATAGAALLRLLAAEGAVVDVLAHSLGTRLFTKAVAALGAGDAMIGNVILLDGAEFALDAAATFAGRRFNVVNVTNEADGVLSTGAEQLGDPSRLAGSMPACSLGRYGLGNPSSWRGNAVYPPNWVDIALDRRDVQDWFKANGGYTLTPADSDSAHTGGHMNHSACYTEAGNRAWLIDLLGKPGMNGGAFARTAALPKGILRDPQPVFAGVAIPDATPMTMAERIAYQRGAAIG